MRDGFLGTPAPFYVDLVLLLEMAMGLALLTGAFLAWRRKFRAHAWCQSVVVLLNAILIALVMLPSFHRQVWPRIPPKLGRFYFGLATAHAALGAVVECAALYILLAAGTTLMPENFRLTRYKLWMRIVLIAWWAVLLLGVTTYARWYVPILFRR
ncbi:MAG TPA: hypothetical protein VNH19_19575 [Candidatus Limnocylindrales bacterium]|nr:hypothetical protein [Candidatus Limnocylindrales bacterium]